MNLRRAIRLVQLPAPAGGAGAGDPLLALARRVGLKSGGYLIFDQTEAMTLGDRVVVPSFIVCGQCWYCQHDLYSLCDNTHPKPELQEPLLGGSVAVPGGRQDRTEVDPRLDALRFAAHQQLRGDQRKPRGGRRDRPGERRSRSDLPEPDA